MRSLMRELSCVALIQIPRGERQLAILLHWELSSAILTFWLNWGARAGVYQAKVLNTCVCVCWDDIAGQFHSEYTVQKGIVISILCLLGCGWGNMTQTMTSNMYMYVHQTIKHIMILLISINKTYQATCNNYCFVIQRHTWMSRVGMVMWFCSLVSQWTIQACKYLKLL